MPERDYLNDLCEYKGPGSDLPRGGYSALPNWGPEKLAKSWTILDAESEAGIAELTTKQLKMQYEDDPSLTILGVTLNANSLNYIIDKSPYKENFFKISDANGGPLMNLDEWYNKYHSNGLALVAIRNMRQILKGDRKVVDINELTRRR